MPRTSKTTQFRGDLVEAGSITPAYSRRRDFSLPAASLARAIALAGLLVLVL